MLLCASAAMGIDSRFAPQMMQVTGGIVIYRVIYIVPAAPANITVIFMPNSGVNHLDFSCSGSDGAAASNTAQTLGGITSVLVPIKSGAWMQKGSSTVNCSGEYGILPNNDLTTFNLSFKVATSGATTDGISSLFVNDPITTATGEFTMRLPGLLDLGGPLPLGLEANYASFINSSGLTTRLGNNWMHNFEWILTTSGNTATVAFYGGKQISFTKTSTGYDLSSPELYGYQLASSGANAFQFLDPRTNLIYTFGGNGSTLGLTSIQDRNGNTLTVTPPSNGTATVTDGLGRTLTFSYDAQSGNVTRVADQAGRTVQFGYTNGNLTTLTDPNGKMQTFAYTTAGTLSGLMTGRTTGSGAVPVSQTYDSVGRVATQADSRGNTTTITYDASGTASYKNPAGVTMSHTSTGAMLFTGFTDPDNRSIAVGYDANNRRNSVTDRAGDRTVLTYHALSGYVASEIDALGNTTTYTWTGQVSGPFTFYNLTKIAFADGSTVLFAYDANGNVTTETDQLGKTIKSTYNSRGQLTSRTDAAGRVTSTTYNNDGTVATTTDRAGNVTTYSYDSAKRVSGIKYVDGSTIALTYDAMNNVLTSTDQRGKTTTYTYNGNGQLQSVTDASGKTASLGFDSNNSAQKVTDRTGASTLYERNSLGLTSAVTNPAGEKTTYDYNTHEQLSTVTDPAGKARSITYDRTDVRLTAKDALNRTTSFTTDKLGRVVQTRTPLGGAFSTTFDAVGRRTAQADAAGIGETLTYDARGAVTGISLTGGLNVGMTRDAAGSVTALTDPNGQVWARTYDSAGRLASVTDPLKRSTALSYDNRNRVASVDNGAAKGTFTYDAAGNRTAASYPDVSLTFTYDANGRVTAASGVTLAYDAEDRITSSNGIAVARDANGRISSITYADGKTVQYAYNSVGLLASVTDWVGGVTTFTYDAAHQLTSIKRANGVGTQFAYDNDGRVASISEDTGLSISITRDAAGKVTSENRTRTPSSLAAGVLPLSYDVANQVNGYTYDVAGRLTGDMLRSYRWDGASRLTSYSGTTNAYDAFGMRTSATSGGSTQNFVWNYATGLPSLAIVQDQRYYVYTPSGTLLYAIDVSSNARHFYHFDENGSTTQLTDDSGAVTDSYEITPYGESVVQRGSTPNPFTWLGAFGVMQEGSTGLFYIRARFYDSATARFLSPDARASADPLEVNPYSYARANPVRFVDVTGREPEEDSVWLTNWIRQRNQIVRPVRFDIENPELRAVSAPEVWGLEVGRARLPNFGGTRLDPTTARFDQLFAVPLTGGSEGSITGNFFADRLINMREFAKWGCGGSSIRADVLKALLGAARRLALAE